MLEVTVKSTDYDLTTTASVKALLGLAATSTGDDVALSIAIRAASRWAESYIGYPLSVQTYRELRPSYDSRRLMLTQTPLRAVKQLFDSSDTGNGSQFLSSEFRVDAEPGFIVRAEGWYWTAPMEQDLEVRPRAGQEFEPWLADYVAGWTYGGVDTGSANWSTEAGTTSTGRTLPEDVEFAVMQRAARLFDDTDGLDMERLGDLSVRYNSRSAGADRPEPYEQLLTDYRRVV